MSRKRGRVDEGWNEQEEEYGRSGLFPYVLAFLSLRLPAYTSAG
jgi:hypothetical protein